MIIVQLRGGIGNQLYQYAAAKSLSLATNNELKLYFEDTNKWTNRAYALGAFNIPEPFASPSEVRRFKPDRGLKRALKKSLGMDVDKKLYLEKENFTFDPSFFKLKGDIFLSGYWQHLQYFQSYEEPIRQCLQFEAPVFGENKAMLERILSAKQAVSVHIRRGDYVSMSEHTGFAILSEDYYQKAASYLSDQLDKPTFFIFSDEPDWVKSSFGFDYPMVVVDVNAEGLPHEDLRLMSSCRHHIIANSTFSWWGAWLNPKKGKIVVAPQQWKANEQPQKEVNRFPEEWKVI